MKISLLFVLICFAQVDVDAKIVVLSGKVYDYSIRNSTSQERKIYYTSPGRYFLSSNFFTCDESFNYQLILSEQIILEKSLGTILFSASITTDLEDEFIQTIWLDRIIDENTWTSKDTIKINSDLFFLESQEVSRATLTTGTAKEFVGEYTMLVDGLLHSVELSGLSNWYKSTGPIRANFMNTEVGEWTFDEEKSHLKFIVSYEMNKRYGIVLKSDKEYVFSVINRNGSISFESEYAKLKRN